VAHSLSKVFFAFFGLPLADENGQDRFFFFEDIRALIMARESCQLSMLLMSFDFLPRQLIHLTELVNSQLSN